MANSLTAFNPAYWAKEMQGIFFREDVALPLANTELRDDLANGDTLHKPYRSYLAGQTYTKGTDISVFNDLTATDETLVVDTAKVVPFYVDDIDKIQNKWDTAAQYAQDSQRVLNNILDQRVLSHYSDARGFISAQDLGGSGTGSIAITSTNISNLFTVASRKMDTQDVPQGMRVAVIGPRLLEQLRLYVGNRETGFGETVSDNGMVAKRFGFDIVVSNNVPWSSLITFGATTNNPTANDTFTLGGVVFTFVSSIGTTAGNVLIETNAVDTMINLANAINNSATGVGTAWVQLSATSRKVLLKGGVSATTPSGTTFTLTGYGDTALAESAANFAITSLSSFPVFMRRGAIDLVVQKSPSVEFRMAEKRLGRYVYPWMMYGSKVFDQMKDAITYCKVDGSGWV